MDTAAPAQQQRIFLYPHTFDCLSVLVPVMWSRQSFVSVFVRQSIVSVIAVVLVLLAVLRIAARLEHIGRAILLTLGLFLTQQRMPPLRGCATYAWISCMLLCSLYASCILSSAIYTIVMTAEYEPEIDTFDQLSISGLPIYVSENSLEFECYTFEVKWSNNYVVNALHVSAPHEKKKGTGAVTWENMCGVFQWYLSGMVVAMLAFGGELVFGRAQTGVCKKNKREPLRISNG